MGRRWNISEIEKNEVYICKSRLTEWSGKESYLCLLKYFVTHRGLVERRSVGVKLFVKSRSSYLKLPCLLSYF